MNKDELRALDDVIKYLWIDEEKDFKSKYDGTYTMYNEHIYLKLKTLSDLYYNERRKKQYKTW